MWHEFEIYSDPPECFLLTGSVLYAHELFPVPALALSHHRVTGMFAQRSQNEPGGELLITIN